MEFRKASINGHVYGKVFSGNQASDQHSEAAKHMVDGLKELFDTKYVRNKPPFVDSSLAHHLKIGEVQSQKIREFFTLLAVCHTVLIEPSKGKDTLAYNAQSPDEAALVSTARDVGFAFVGRENNDCRVNVMGELRTYAVLHIMEFNSDRKRMSVIVRRPEGQYILLCKGADSVIYERLSVDDNDPTTVEKTLNHLSTFANDGKNLLQQD
jgi:phospholipid-translocating ATPase